MDELEACSKHPSTRNDPEETPEGGNSFLAGDGQGKHRVSAVIARSVFWERSFADNECNGLNPIPLLYARALWAEIPAPVTRHRFT